MSGSGKKQKRLFIAIEIPRQWAERFAALRTLAEHPSLRWTPAQNLHVTLHFIGETDEEDMRLLEEKIASVASLTASFGLTTDKLKVIKRNRKPVMAWVCFQESAPFTRLALELRKALNGNENKPPVPHITLARIKGKWLKTPILPEIKEISIMVDAICLMESTPGNSHPVYSELSRFEFQGKQ